MDRHFVVFINFCLLTSLMLAGCAATSTETVTPVHTTEIQLIEQDLRDSAECWLKKYNKDWTFGTQIGNGQCTAVARNLTDAVGYGQDPDGSYLGGLDYIRKLQRNDEKTYLLSEVKNDKDFGVCDSLILTKGFSSAGHTAVVFYKDLQNNTLWYLDQNIWYEDKDGKTIQSGVELRSMKISEHEDSAYVIEAPCKIEPQPYCGLVTGTGPIIALPEEEPPEVNQTIESVTITEPSVSLDKTDEEAIARWINESLQEGNANMFNSIIEKMPKFWAFSNPDCYGPSCPCQNTMGKWCDISKADFITEIDNRMASRPHCVYEVYSSIDQLIIYTYGWSPTWSWPYGEADNMMFTFYKVTKTGEYQLDTIEFNSPNTADIPCP